MRSKAVSSMAVGALVLVLGVLQPSTAYAQTYSAVPGGFVMFGTNTADFINITADRGTAFAKRAEDQIFGGSGKDLLLPGAGADRVYGGAEADTIIDDGGIGADVISGGDEDDKIFSADGDADTIDCGPGDDQVLGDPEDSTTGCERVLTESLPLGFTMIMFGTNNADVLTGASGPDLLFGKSGNDTLVGLTGTDLLFGGAGVDTLDGGPDTDLLIDDDGEPGDQLIGGDGSDVFFAADGAVDTIDCGAGHDVAFVDSDDVVQGCETVVTS